MNFPKHEPCQIEFRKDNGLLTFIWDLPDERGHYWRATVLQNVVNLLDKKPNVIRYLKIRRMK